MRLARCYARERYRGMPGPYLFLAGPTARDEHGPRWRDEAIQHLERISEGIGLGTVIIPEDEDFGNFDDANMDAQVDWEWETLDAADAVLFWVPRSMDLLPGLTTNVEFGMYADSKKVVLGYPPAAEHCGYLKRLAVRYKVPVSHDLATTCIAGATLARARYNLR